MRRAKQMSMGMWGSVPPPIAGNLPGDLTDFTASPNLDGTIVMAWTLPARATHVWISYSVDQATAPTHPYLGIEIGLRSGTSYTFTGATYGANYKFSAWAWNASGFSTVRDGQSVVGPFNPAVYGGDLTLWLDARRETAYADLEDVTTPQEFAQGLVFTQAVVSKKAHWRSGLNGINSMPCFEFTRADTMMYDGPGTELHTDGAGGGLTVAAIYKTSDVAVTEHILSKWEDSGREWDLQKSSGDPLFFVSEDGAGVSKQYVASSGGFDDLNAHAIIGVWIPGQRMDFYGDGALQGTNLNGNWLAIESIPGTTLRFGANRHSTSECFAGLIALVVAWNAGMDTMNATILAEDLAAMAGL